ncbi:MAG: hypothetical protein ABIY70_19205 [Capsulimonas sp.]|uniref:hypothetical protein n=1 Tax=Capsulimonas sp. TaxID=2494211 RepID=UPI003263B790
MKHDRAFVAVILSAIILPFCIVSVIGGMQSTIVDLGSMRGQTSAAMAINNAGDVVGQANSTAFLWRHGHMAKLPMLLNRSDPSSPPANSIAYSINDAGVIAGDCDTDGGEILGTERGQYNAVLWDHGAIRDLGSLPGYLCASARHINNAGVTVGLGVNESMGFGTREYKAAVGVYTPGKTFRMSNARLYAENSQGDRVEAIRMHGATRIRLTIGGVARLLDEIKFPEMPLDVFINDQRQVVMNVGRQGSGEPGDSDSIGSYIVTWRNGSVRTILPSITGFPETSASGVNNRGEIVGFAYNPSQYSSGTRGVLWNGSSIVDLTKTYTQGTFWTIERAAGINDAGVVVGTGREAGLNPRAILLKTR